MVHRTYLGLGTFEAAVREFEGLRPHVRTLWGLQDGFGYFSADGSAIEIALNALQTTIFHFTRQPHFFGERDPASAPNLTSCLGASRLRSLAPIPSAAAGAAGALQALRARLASPQHRAARS